MDELLNPAAINGLLQALLSQMSGSARGAGVTTSPYSADMSRTITGTISSPMLSQLLGSFFPGLKATPGNDLLWANFEEMLRRQMLRKQSASRYKISPSMLAMLRGLGMSQESVLDTTTGRPTAMGNILSSMYNQFIGPTVGDPFLMRGEIENQSRDLYQGLMFGRSGRQAALRGLTEEEIKSQVSSLFTSAHPDGKFTPATPFAAGEMFEVQRLGAERGLFSGASVSDIQKRTHDLAKLVKLGQGVFETLDKEGVLESIQSMVRGQVPLSDTGSLQRILYHVSALAKSANTSIEVMSRLASEGAELYSQVGIGKGVGAQLHLASARQAEVLMAQSGEIGRAVVGQDSVAAAGGARVVTSLFQQMQVGLLGSSHAQKSLWLLREMNQKPALKGERDAFLKKYLAGTVSDADISGGIDSLAKVGQVQRSLVVARMETERAQAATEAYKDDTEGELAAAAEANFVWQTVIPGLPSDQRSLFAPAALLDENLDRDRQAALISKLREVVPNITAEQAAVLSQRLLVTAVGRRAPEGSMLQRQYADLQGREQADRRSIQAAAWHAQILQERVTAGAGGFLDRVVDTAMEGGAADAVSEAWRSLTTAEDQETRDIAQRLMTDVTHSSDLDRIFDRPSVMRAISSVQRKEAFDLLWKQFQPAFAQTEEGVRVTAFLEELGAFAGGGFLETDLPMILRLAEHEADKLDTADPALSTEDRDALEKIYQKEGLSPRAIQRVYETGFYSPDQGLRAYFRLAKERDPERYARFTRTAAALNTDETSAALANFRQRLISGRVETEDDARLITPGQDILRRLLGQAGPISQGDTNQLVRENFSLSRSTNLFERLHEAIRKAQAQREAALSAALTAAPTEASFASSFAKAVLAEEDNSKSLPEETRTKPKTRRFQDAAIEAARSGNIKTLTENLGQRLGRVPTPEEVGEYYRWAKTSFVSRATISNSEMRETVAFDFGKGPTKATWLALATPTPPSQADPAVDEIANNTKETAEAATDLKGLITKFITWLMDVIPKQLGVAPPPAGPN